MECKGCTKGIAFCYHRPCWGLPEEFDKIIDAGFSDKLQLDFYYQKALGKEDIEILSGAVYQEVGTTMFSFLFDSFNTTPRMEREYEDFHNGGKKADMNPLGKCALLTEDNLCSLHDLGLKPEEGRESCCKTLGELERSHEDYAKLWDTDYGRSVVQKWKNLINYKDEDSL